MEIVLWKALAIVKDHVAKLMASPRKAGANRRACKYDRRRSAIDGVVVSLSTKVERRRNPERRKQTPASPF